MMALPDIVFMLLIFFMVTTVMRTVTLKVQTRLPQAEAVQKIEQKRLVAYLYVGRERQSGRQVGDMSVQIDDAIVDMEDIRFIMYRKLTEQPRLIVSLRVDEDASMGYLTDVQQELREAGTLRVNYSTKRQASTTS